MENVTWIKVAKLDLSSALLCSGICRILSYCTAHVPHPFVSRNAGQFFPPKIAMNHRLNDGPVRLRKSLWSRQAGDLCAAINSMARRQLDLSLRDGFNFSNRSLWNISSDEAEAMGLSFFDLAGWMRFSRSCALRYAGRGR